MIITNQWHFVGQKNLINRLIIMIRASKIQNLPLEHIMLIGSAGMGKTTIATNIAKEFQSNLSSIQGTSIKKASDIISVLTNLKPYDIIFIDEIHSVDHEILEILYTALEGNYIKIIIGKDYNNKVIKIDLPKFTMIAATNKVGNLTKALLSRIPVILHLEKYFVEDIKMLILLTSQNLNWVISENIITVLINYCRFIPRMVINMIRQLYNYCLVNKIKLDHKNVYSVMKFLNIYYYGLNHLEVSYLKLFDNKCQQFYLSLETISSILSEERKNIEYHCEPLLLQLSLIVKTNKGRALTDKGRQYLEDFIKIN